MTDKCRGVIQDSQELFTSHTVHKYMYVHNVICTPSISTLCVQVTGYIHRRVIHVHVGGLVCIRGNKWQLQILSFINPPQRRKILQTLRAVES